MKIFIDFEATQPEEEIISVGVYLENGNHFYSLVKPRFSTISSYISELTGIQPEVLDKAWSLDYVFVDLYNWLKTREPLETKWHFYSYGDKDVHFIKQSLKNITSCNALILASIMIATLKDYSKYTTKYFKEQVSLIKAFNYFKDLNNKQNHNALEDAEMLCFIDKQICNKEPLTISPFKPKNNISPSYTYPSGIFYCKDTPKKKSLKQQFNCCEDAVEWLIETKIKKKKEIVHRDRIANRIMKSIRTNQPYMGYFWSRIKKRR